MIKKGLTNTQTQSFSRPKTAASNYRSHKEKSQTLEKNKFIDIPQKQKKHYEPIADSTI